MDGAMSEFQTAVQLDGKSAAAHFNLGNAFSKKGNLDEAFREYQIAVQLDPNLALAHTNLGACYQRRNDLDAAIREHKIAVKLAPDLAAVHSDFASTLWAKGMREEAISEYRTAVQLQPDNAAAHANLGQSLHEKADYEEAIREFQTALHIDPRLEPVRMSLGAAHINFGHVLVRQRNFDRAISEFEAGLKIHPGENGAHFDLGNALFQKGDMDGAVREYQAAIKNGYTQGYNNLGLALARKQDMSGAADAYQNAIKISPTDPNPHFNIGLVYLHQGRFTEAVDSLKNACGLAKDRKDWADLLHEAERLAELDAKLPAMLGGNAKPKDSAEAMNLALICQNHRKRYTVATRFYSDAFALDPKLAADQDATHRYNAACAAALAGCGQGEDAAALDEKLRAQLRRQALDWLGEDLAYYGRLTEGAPGEIRSFVQKRLEHWLDDTDLAGVRGEALDKLPEAEQPGWRRLWSEVEQTLRRAGAQK
jgi:tetratricopeptide (TPR) repeat protein